MSPDFGIYTGPVTVLDIGDSHLVEYWPENDSIRLFGSESILHLEKAIDVGIDLFRDFFFIIICLLSSLIQFHIVLGLYFLFTRKQAAFSVVNPDKIFGQSRVLVKIWLSRFRGFIYDTPRGRV